MRGEYDCNMELNSSTLATHSGTAHELGAIRHDNAKGRKKSRGYLDQKHATRVHTRGKAERSRATFEQRSPTRYAVEALGGNASGDQGRQLPRLEGPIRKTRPDVKRTVGENIATRKENMIINFAGWCIRKSGESAKPHSFCFSYELPSHPRLRSPHHQAS